MTTANKATPQQLEAIGAIAAKMVQPGNRVGLGSGKAALAFVRALGARVKSEKLNIVGVATSLLTEHVAREAGVPVSTLAEVSELDITVDGADEVDPSLNLTKGGGGNLTREKVIASISRRFVIVVGEEKLVDRLGANFPVFVEVIEFARPVVIRKIQALGASVQPRLNPDGSPFLTDNANPYLHCNFTNAPGDPLLNPLALDLKLHHTPGVVETGLFIAMASEIIVAHVDGSVKQIARRKDEHDA